MSFLLLLLLPMILILDACQGCPPTTLKTIDLQAVQVQSGLSGGAIAQGFCFGPSNAPPSAFWPPPGGTGQVGFDDSFQPGAPPFPCDNIGNSDFRTGVRFDLSQFDNVTAALLLFDTASSISRSGGKLVNESPAVSHANTLGVSTQPFNSAELPDTNEVSLPGGPSVSVAVGSQVNDWLKNVIANNGFIISGPETPFDSTNPRKDSDASVSWYTNFRLEVTYNPGLNPRAPQ